MRDGDKWKNVVRAYSSKPDPKEIKKLLNNKNIAMTASINPFRNYGVTL